MNKWKIKKEAAQLKVNLGTNVTRPGRINDSEMNDEQRLELNYHDNNIQINMYYKNINNKDFLSQSDFLTKENMIKHLQLKKQIQQELSPIFDEFINKINSILENKGFKNWNN